MYPETESSAPIEQDYDAIHEAHDDFINDLSERLYNDDYDSKSDD